MATVAVRPSNGVSFGLKHVVTATDASDGYVLFNFRVATGSSFRYALSATVQVTAATTNIVTNPADIAVTYPLAGQVRVAGTLVSGSTINLICQKDSLAV
jgi:hypothetical protein